MASVIFHAFRSSVAAVGLDIAHQSRYKHVAGLAAAAQLHTLPFRHLSTVPSQLSPSYTEGIFQTRCSCGPLHVAHTSPSQQLANCVLVNALLVSTVVIGNTLPSTEGHLCFAGALNLEYEALVSSKVLKADQHQVRSPFVQHLSLCLALLLGLVGSWYHECRACMHPVTNNSPHQVVFSDLIRSAGQGCEPFEPAL